DDREEGRGGRVVAAAPALDREAVYRDHVAAAVEEQVLRLGAHRLGGLLAHPAGGVEDGVPGLVLPRVGMVPRPVPHDAACEQLLHAGGVAGGHRLHDLTYRLDVWMLSH